MSAQLSAEQIAALISENAAAYSNDAPALTEAERQQDIPFSVVSLGSYGPALVLPDYYKSSCSEVKPPPPCFPDPVQHYSDRYLNMDKLMEDSQFPINMLYPELGVPDCVFQADPLPAPIRLEAPLLPTLFDQCAQIFPELAKASLDAGIVDPAHTSGLAIFPWQVPGAVGCGEPRSDIELTEQWLLGQLDTAREVLVVDTGDARTSTSIDRAPVSGSDFVRGSVNNLPFRPGGIDEQNREHDQLQRMPVVGSAALAAVMAEGAGTISTDPDLFDFMLPASKRKRPVMTSMPGFAFSRPWQPPTDAGEVVSDCSAPEEQVQMSRPGVNPEGLIDQFAFMTSEQLDSAWKEADDKKRELDKTNIERNKGSVAVSTLNLEDVFRMSLSVEEALVGPPLTAQPAMADAPDAPASVAQSASAPEDSGFIDDLLGLDSDKAASMLESQRRQAVAASSVDKKYEWAVADHSDVSQYSMLVPQPAISFPFELDTFQKQAVMRLEKGECVFVAAHTSAGKTVVAEYAVALAAKHLTRCVYTSPIKTLSNQKFREFKRTFGDVGLVTGDVSVNPEASCLILTTEILRSMLYKGADLIRDIEWVIFDEVHYINDAERGVVWEEVIIMLPAHINIILLSATVPNTMEFADWVGRTKKKRVHVISTLKRPVPLQHYLWSNNQMFKIVDEKGAFLLSGFRDARAPKKSEKSSVLLSTAGAKASAKPIVPVKGSSGAAGVAAGKRADKMFTGQSASAIAATTSSTSAAGGGSMNVPQAAGMDMNRVRAERHTWLPLVQYLQKLELLPVVIFSFSRKNASAAAYALSTMDMTTAQEKSEIHMILEGALRRLRPEDRELPQLQRIRELLRVGVGLHHAGLLPLVKEVVELCFGRGLLRVLFATETFAMGVNMPTRTVVFNGIRKHDGTQHRFLTPAEYTQMAGRAGRRGLDSFGNVVIHCHDDELPDELVVKAMLTGPSGKLESKFRLTYSMIINLLRVEDMHVEDMIRRSFSEFFMQRDRPSQQLMIQSMERRIAQLLERAGECVHHNAASVKTYYDIYSELRTARSSVWRRLMQLPKAAEAAFKPGRLMTVNLPRLALFNCQAMLLQVQAPPQADRLGAQVAAVQKTYMAIVLCPERWQLPAAIAAKQSDLIHGQARDFKYVVVQIRAPDMVCMYKVVVKIAPTAASDVLDKRDAMAAHTLLLSIHQNLGDSEDDRPPELDLVAELRTNDLDFVDAYSDLNVARQMLLTSDAACRDCPQLETHLALLDQALLLEQTLRDSGLRAAVNDENVELMNDFQQRLDVLQALGYIDEHRIVQLKGRVAAEVNTCDALIVSELVFENVLTDLPPDEAVALLSALVFQQKNTPEQLELVPESLRQAVAKVKTLTTGLAHLQLQKGIRVTAEEYLRDNLNFGLLHVVYEWAQGTTFAKICELTEVDEGTIVRCITRLDETCRDVRNCARVIGDPALFQKAQTASEIIKRDICFAASLYLN